MLPPNFTLKEFTDSHIATVHNIPNELPQELIPDALETLWMMQRIRDYLSNRAGKIVPIKLSSGYRNPRLNYVVRTKSFGPGEDATGDHPKAAAADFSAPTFGNALQVAKALAPVVGQLQIGQLIYEHTWVHASTKLPLRPVNRVLTVAGKKYLPGIIA